MSSTAQLTDQTSKNPNPLISTQGSSELQVILHPLVLLTISDYITRHTLRKHEGPVVGVMLGQQNGREITIEHAFECHMHQDPGAPGGFAVHPDNFRERYEQSWLIFSIYPHVESNCVVTVKMVHKDRQLDLVGWYTLLPSTGPTPTIIHVHSFFLTEYNESALLLGFHPDQILSQSAGGKLPLTIYESNWEVEGGAKPDQDVEDKNMDDGENRLHLKFLELTYSVETDETEMISMNYVAGGSGSANATSTKEEKPSRSIETNGKGKRRLVESTDQSEQSQSDIALTREEDEMIASLTTKANAIKMLQSRLRLITAYLERLPPSFVNGEKIGEESMDTNNATIPSFTVLRQIQALVSRLDLVIPSDKESFERELLQETNDVNLIQLLNTVVQNADQARDVGKKFGIVETAKSNRRAPVEYHATQSQPSGHSAGDLMM